MNGESSWPAASPVSFSGATLTETFAYSDNIEYVESLTRATTLTKDSANNPIIESTGATASNEQILSYVSATYHGGQYHLHYYGAEIGAGNRFLHYAYSADGVTWTKPSIGRVSYGGSTDNNIVIDGTCVSAGYESSISKWVFAFERPSSADDASVTAGLWVYTADNPDGPLTLAARPSSGFLGYHEGKEIIRRPDGHWVGYHVQGHSTDLRSITAWLSDTTDLTTTTWTKYERQIIAPSTAGQFYKISVNRVGEVYFGLVTRFDSTGDGVLTGELWASPDAVSDWVRVGDALLTPGSSGAWDDMDVRPDRICEVGDTWLVYYNGAPNGHETADVNLNRAIGRATTGRGRLIRWNGTGTLRTFPITVIEGAYSTAALSVNADASGGSLKIELQDANGSALEGYSFADFDTITSDGYSHTPTWGGSSFPAESVVSLAFSLTSASLYGFTITRS